MTEAQAAALEALRLRFLARSNSDLERLRLHLSGSELPLTELRLLVHRLAGAAGTFGYPDLGAVAKRLDEQIFDRPLSKAELKRLVLALETATAAEALEG